MVGGKVELAQRNDCLVERTNAMVGTKQKLWVHTQNLQPMQSVAGTHA